MEVHRSIKYILSDRPCQESICISQCKHFQAKGLPELCTGLAESRFLARDVKIIHIAHCGRGACGREH